MLSIHPNISGQILSQIVSLGCFKFKTCFAPHCLYALTCSSFDFRNGCASHFLTTLPIGGRFLSYHFSNDLFRMPNDPTLHIIMVCAGSGIAPFRAFWQHRKNKRGYKKTSAWLYYGCRYRNFYIYYTVKLQTILPNNITYVTI